MITNPIPPTKKGHDPTRQNCITSYPRELLVGMEPKMSESTAHPQPPTIRLHPNK